jgi:single-strand DNA-binding protein
MSRTFNKIAIVGFVGKDAEIRYTNTGKAVASFSLATTERRKDRQTGQPVDHTEWFRISCWDRLAEIAGEYVKKGKQVYVEGPVTTSSYDDKDGNKRFSLDVTARELHLLDAQGGQSGGQSGGSGSGYGQQQPQQQQQSSYRPAAPQSAPAEFEPAGMSDDDLPF